VNSSAADVETTASCESFAVNFHGRCLQGWIDQPWSGSESTCYGWVQYSRLARKEAIHSEVESQVHLGVAS
jgi:hypothetical protein